ERRHRHAAAVDLEVAVRHHLARFGAGCGEAQPEDDIVQAPLEETQEVLPRHAPLALRLGEVAPELPLEEPVDTFGLLLLAELLAIGRLLGSAQPMLPRRVVAALDRALAREAARALQEQLQALPPAQPADRVVVPCQLLSSSLHPATLGRPA